MSFPRMKKVRCSKCGTYLSPTSMFYKEGKTIICLKCMWKLGGKKRGRR